MATASLNRIRLNETSCEAAGGEWEDGVCSEEEQEDDEIEENDNETEVDYSGCINITNRTLCEARKNCQYNNVTEKCERIIKIKKLKETLQAYLNSTECPKDCVCAGSTIKCETENGRVMTVVAGRSGNIIIQTKSINATTTVILTKNNTGLFGSFSGKIKKIKYFPDEIQERVLKRLKMTECENCTIELRNDGTYLMNVEGVYRILGLFPKKAIMVTKTDSETGEIILIKRPWWKFLAVKSKK